MHHLQRNAEQQLNENIEEDVIEASVNEDVRPKAPDLITSAGIVDEGALPGHGPDGGDLLEYDAVVDEEGNLDDADDDDELLKKTLARLR